MVQLLTYLLNHGIHLQKKLWVKSYGSRHNGNCKSNSFQIFKLLQNLDATIHPAPGMARWVSKEGRFEQRWKTAIICKKTSCFSHLSTLFQSGWITAHEPSNWNLSCISAFFKPQSFLELDKERNESNFCQKWHCEYTFHKKVINLIYKILWNWIWKSK